MVNVDETTPEFQSCVTKVFWKKIWDALSSLGCLIFGFVAVACSALTVMSFLPPPERGAFELLSTLFVVGRVGAVISVVILIMAWIHDVKVEAVKECREVYAKK